jgi:hypothetical protein
MGTIDKLKQDVREGRTSAVPLKPQVERPAKVIPGVPRAG